MSQVTTSSSASSYRWEKEETEDLISWMEDNLEVMKGKQALWFKQAKDDIFEGKDQITGVRI
ncbi:hypothetical protein BGX38DRAFT_1197188, partial [Terfezia claveryi]